jgi:hypothetical protein
LGIGEKMPETQVSQDEGNARAKAFERAYKESHPEGPYPPVELKPEPESQTLSKAYEIRKVLKENQPHQQC